MLVSPRVDGVETEPEAPRRRRCQAETGVRPRN
jgi:hypothetical protein